MKAMQQLKICLYIILLTLIAGPLSAQKDASKQTKKDFKQLTWILDTWERTNGKTGTTAFESWEKSGAYTYSGMGWSMKGSDTTFVEKLRIEIKEDKIYYVADVRANTEPTYFLITEMTEHGFKSENPDHDFPKVISYALKDNQLTAVISDGADKKMGFVFKRD